MKNDLGKRVVKVAGAYREGKVIEPFPWRESTDGTYKEPSKDHIPVLWQNGEKGYINCIHVIIYG